MAMAAVQLMNTSTAMAQHSAAANATSAVPAASHHMFHDFLGLKQQPPEDHRSRRPSAASSPAASASAGASSGGGRGGPISTTSPDLGSAERQVGNPIEGVPFYGARSDVSAGTDLTSNRLMRYKRSSSDLAFMGSAREYATLHTRPEVHDNLPLMKMLRSGLGGERPRQPPSSSLMLHHPRTISSSSRLDPRFVPSNVGPALQFPLRGGPFMPPMQPPPPNLYRDVHHHHHVIGAPVIASSQSAAAAFDEEGSRTGFKAPPGILNSVHIAAAGGGSSEKKKSPMSLGISHSGTTTVNTNPKCSNPPRIDAASLVGRQMTIFYGGQAHVFDEVSPTKAELIMSLAGSSGGSWSTTSAPKSTTSSAPSSTAPPKDPRQQIPGSSQRSLESTDRRFSNTTGGLPRSILGKDATNPTQVADDGEKKQVNEE